MPPKSESESSLPIRTRRSWARRFRTTARRIPGRAHEIGKLRVVQGGYRTAELLKSMLR